jgi:hypothetical protein
MGTVKVEEVRQAGGVKGMGWDQEGWQTCQNPGESGHRGQILTGIGGTS